MKFILSSENCADVPTIGSRNILGFPGMNEKEQSEIILSLFVDNKNVKNAVYRDVLIENVHTKDSLEYILYGRKLSKNNKFN